MNTYLLRLVACLLLLLSFNAKALVVNGYEITFDADLSGADFSYIDLSSVDFFNSNLENASFFGSDLSGSDLSQTQNWLTADFANASYNLGTIFPFISGLQAGEILVTLESSPFNGVVPQVCDETPYSGATCTVFRDIAEGEFLAALTPDGLIYSGIWYQSTLDPISEGMIFVSEVPLPAGIYLFLSGLVGLGLMRGRNA